MRGGRAGNPICVKEKGENERRGRRGEKGKVQREILSVRSKVQERDEKKK